MILQENDTSFEIANAYLLHCMFNTITIEMVKHLPQHDENSGGYKLTGLLKKFDSQSHTFEHISGSTLTKMVAWKWYILPYNKRSIYNNEPDPKKQNEMLIAISYHDIKEISPTYS